MLRYFCYFLFANDFYYVEVCFKILKGLQEAVCERYEVVKYEYNRLLGKDISGIFG